MCFKYTTRGKTATYMGWMRRLKGYNRVLLTIVIMLYVRCPELIHLITECCTL